MASWPLSLRTGSSIEGSREIDEWICLHTLSFKSLMWALPTFFPSSVSSSTTTGERNLQIRYGPSNFLANFAATKFTADESIFLPFQTKSSILNLTSYPVVLQYLASFSDTSNWNFDTRSCKACILDTRLFHYSTDIFLIGTLVFSSLSKMLGSFNSLPKFKNADDVFVKAYSAVFIAYRNSGRCSSQSSVGKTSFHESNSSISSK